MWLRLACAGFFLCVAGHAYAAAKKEAQPLRVERVVAIKSDGMLQLSSSGLAALKHVIWPDAALAESWLAQHSLQQNIAYTADAEDRYGRLQIESEMVQDALRDGAATLYISDGKAPDAWHVAEVQARAAKRGVWAKPDWVISPETAAKYLGEFRVVEGRVSKIYKGKSATYINFGDDWKSDFSVMVAGKHRRAMQGLFDALKPGDMLQVRGVVFEENGPMIAVINSGNLEQR